MKMIRKLRPVTICGVIKGRQQRVDGIGPRKCPRAGTKAAAGPITTAAAALSVANVALRTKPSRKARRANALIYYRNGNSWGETAPGDRADQATFCPERGTQRRDVRLQIALLDNPVGPYTGHRRVLADGGSARFAISAINTSDARLPRLTIGPELAAMRQHSKTTEHDAPQCF
jgi:hypothetical protein